MQRPADYPKPKSELRTDAAALIAAFQAAGRQPTVCRPRKVC